MNELLTKLDGRMDHLEVMMGQLIDMVGKNNQKITEMHGRQDKVDSRFDDMDSRLDKIDTRLERVENSQERMDARLGRVEECQHSMGKKLEEIDGKVDRVDRVVDQLNFDTRAINKRVFKNESDIERLIEQ